jgi:hypothetical protein
MAPQLSISQYPNHIPHVDEPLRLSFFQQQGGETNIRPLQ